MGEASPLAVSPRIQQEAGKHPDDWWMGRTQLYWKYYITRPYLVQVLPRGTVLQIRDG